MLCVNWVDTNWREFRCVLLGHFYDLVPCIILIDFGVHDFGVA